MSWGIHYFITKLKTKIDDIPMSRFNYSLYEDSTTIYLSRYYVSVKKNNSE